VVGDYTFRLKVTDAAGQESTADVRVFVKPGQLAALYNNVLRLELLTIKRQ